MSAKQSTKAHRRITWKDPESHSHPELVDLTTRYPMHADTWIASKRGFPFNIKLDRLLLFFLALPLTVAFTVFRFLSHQLWTVLGLTVVMGVVAFFICNALIEQMKGSIA